MPAPPFQGEAVVSCGSGAVVIGERVSDAPHRVAGLEGDVVGDPPDGADQPQQLGDATAGGFGRWKVVDTAGLRPVEVPAGG